MTDTTILAVLGIAISLLSLGVSATTMYFAWLRRGRLSMTRPTLVFFGYDEVPRTIPKVFLRALLYSTSPQGKMVEHMYAKLIRAGTEQVFGFWGYGPARELSPGSGLFVGQTGVAANHHFVLSVHEADYEFLPGQYMIRVFAHEVRRSTPKQLSEIELNLSPDHAAALADHQGVLFELDARTRTYLGHIQDRAPRV